MTEGRWLTAWIVVGLILLAGLSSIFWILHSY